MFLKIERFDGKRGVTRATKSFLARLNPVTSDAFYLWGSLTRGVRYDGWRYKSSG